MAGIQLRRSTTPGAVPSSLQEGELALNVADGKLYAKVAGQIAVIGDVSLLNDAPVDGRAYARVDGDWLDISTHLTGFLPEPATLTITSANDGYYSGYAKNYFARHANSILSKTFGSLPTAQQRWRNTDILSVGNNFNDFTTSYRNVSVIVQGERAQDFISEVDIEDGSYVFSTENVNNYFYDSSKSITVWIWRTFANVFPTNNASYTVILRP